MALYHEHPVFGADHVRKRIDIPQLTRFATVADDPDRAFATTLEKTARLAVYERDAYDVSTASLLAGTPLEEYDAHHQTFEYDRQFRWRDFVRGTQPTGRDYQLMPDDGETFTYWNVDHQTGSLLGILPDGSGGGSTEEGIRRQLAELDRVISMINLLAQGVQKAGALSGPGGLALGVVAAYGQLLARLYGAAALAITIMDASGLEAAIARALGDFACEVSKNLFYEAMGMEVWPGIENLIGAMGGNSPVSCG